MTDKEKQEEQEALRNITVSSEPMDVKKAFISNMSNKKLIRERFETLLDRLNNFADELSDDELQPYIRMVLTAPQYEGKPIDKLSLEDDSVFWQVAVEATTLKNEIESKILQPFIDKELKKSKYNNRSFDDLFSSDDGMFWELITAARQAARRSDKAKNKFAKRQKKNQKSFSKVKYDDDFKFNFPVSNFFKNFFNTHTGDDPDQTHIDKELSPSADVLKNTGIPVQIANINGKKVFLFYDYSIDGASMQDKLNISNASPLFKPADAFIAAALDNLNRNGNKEVTLTKIWHELGNTGTPNSTQLTELFKSLYKGRRTDIISNYVEAAANWGNGNEKSKDESTEDEITGELDIRRVFNIELKKIKYSVNSSGEMTISSGIVEIKGQTVFSEFSALTKQYTTFDKSFLTLYKGQRNDRYWSLLYFLMSEIAWMKHPGSKRRHKIIYSTVFEKMHATDGKQRSDILKKLYKILDEMFVGSGYIAGRAESTRGEPGVEIYLTEAEKRRKQPKSITKK